MIDEPDDPVTLWIEQLKDGKPEAAQPLWECFFVRLHAIAKKRIVKMESRVYDEEDAAQSAFNSLCNGIIAGRFPDLNDRDSLWRLLVTITCRKVARRISYESSQKRDANRICRISQNGSNGNHPLDIVQSVEPTAEMVAEMRDTLEWLMDHLPEETLFEVCYLKLEGFRDDEIAAKMNCSRRTVQRKIEVIRKTWESIHDE